MIEFYIIGAIGFFSAVWAVIEKNLFRAALALTIFLLSIASFYFALNAQFLGSIQIIVYVGAVVTLLLFTIMLTRGEEVEG